MLPLEKKLKMHCYGTGVKTVIICNVGRCGMDEVIHHSAVIEQVLLQHYDKLQLAG